MAKALTAAAVKNWKAKSNRQEIPDAVMPGLYLVVQPSSIKSWAFRFRFAGESAKYTIGRYPAISLADARDETSRLQLMVMRGTDPREDRRRLQAEAAEAAQAESDLFEDVVADFIERYAKVNNKTWKETESLFERLFIPKWNGRRVQDITSKDVRGVLQELVDGGMGVGANRALSKLRKMYNWLLENERIEKSPCAKVKPPVSEEERDRVLSDRELTLAWRAADLMGYPNGEMVQFLILSLQRLREVTDAPWREFRRTNTCVEWSLPKERTKTKVAQDLCLPQQYAQIFDKLPRVADSKFMFTTTGRTPISGFSKAKQRLVQIMTDLARKDAIEAGRDPDEETIEHFTLHDFRRTGATGMAKLGVPPHVVEAILNHKSGVVSGVAAVYNRWEYDAEKAAALNRWAERVESLVTECTVKEKAHVS